MAIVTNPDRRIHKYRQAGKGFKRDILLANSHHVVRWFDDFQGDVLDAKYTIVEGGSGDSVSIVAGTLNGVMVVDSGTSNDNSASWELGLHFKGDLNAVFEARVKLEALADCKFAMGFTDALFAEDAAGPVDVLATPSMNAGDAAVWVLDTDDTGNLELQAIAVKGGTIFSGGEGAAKAIEPSVGIPTSGATPIGPTFVAGEYLTLTVALQGDSVRFIAEMDDGDVATTGVDEPYFDSGWIGDGVAPGTPAGIEGGTLLTPFIHSVTRNDGVGNYAHVDYVDIWQSRV